MGTRWALGRCTRRIEPGLGTLLLATLWLAAPCGARAQTLQVVELSAQDASTTAKLEELLGHALAHVRATSAVEASALACSKGARRALLLDAERHSVELRGCDDGMLLHRQTAPSHSEEPAYVAAFVAAELLALDAQLTAATPAPPPIIARESKPPPPHGIQLRVAAEWLALGGAFSGSLRPNLGLGLTRPLTETLAWAFEFVGAPLAQGKVALPSGQIALTRHDFALRAGLRFALAPVALVGFVQARAGLTAARFTKAETSPGPQWRTGLGGGIQAELALTRWALVYTALTLDAAVSRTDYRIAGVSRARDPAQLLGIAAGLCFYPEP